MNTISPPYMLPNNRSGSDTGLATSSIMRNNKLTGANHRPNATGNAAGGAPRRVPHRAEDQQAHYAGNEQRIEMKSPEPVTDVKVGQVMRDVFAGGLCTHSATT